jgi:hypothetical protein
LAQACLRGEAKTGKNNLKKSSRIASTCHRTITFGDRIPREDFMKKLLAVLLLFAVSLPMFAQSESISSIAGMIKNDLFKNQDRIKEASSSLKQTDKMILYNECKKDQWVPFLVNFVVGAGIGSFIEGDKTGGTIALVGDLVGMGAVAFGAAAYSSEIYSNPYTTKGLGTMTLGYVALIGTRIFEIIRPFTYTARYNSTLKGTLGYFDGLSFAPTVENGVAGLAVAYKVKLN